MDEVERGNVGPTDLVPRIEKRSSPEVRGGVFRSLRASPTIPTVRRERPRCGGTRRDGVAGWIDESAILREGPSPLLSPFVLAYRKKDRPTVVFRVRS